MAGAFAILVKLLEAYRLEQLKLLAKEKEPVKQLTAERKEAEEFLLQSDLLHYQNAIDKSLRNLGDTYDVHTFERFYDSYYKKGAGAITN